MKLNNMSENGNKFRRYLYNEVSLVLAIIGVISGFIFWIQNPQQSLEKELVRIETKIEANDEISKQIANIKDNDLHELQIKMDSLADKQVQLLERMARLEALLKENGR